MSQYINLLGPAFRREPMLPSLNRAALLIMLVLVAMTGQFGYDWSRIEGLREELASAQMLLKGQTGYTSRLKGDGAQKGSTVLAADILRLEAELKSARDSMAVLEGGALGNRDGFARYMQAFSRQALEGLWLTHFSVGGSGEVAIKGRVVRPELVPAYIQRLNGEPALKGREFSALEMHRPAPSPAVAAEPGKEAKPEQAPRYLEFALATSEPEGVDSRGEKR